MAQDQFTETLKLLSQGGLGRTATCGVLGFPWRIFGSIGTREIRDWITVGSEGFSEPRKPECVCHGRD